MELIVYRPSNEILRIPSSLKSPREARDLNSTLIQELYDKLLQKCRPECHRGWKLFKSNTVQDEFAFHMDDAAHPDRMFATGDIITKRELKKPKKFTAVCFGHFVNDHGVYRLYCVAIAENGALEFIELNHLAHFGGVYRVDSTLTQPKIAKIKAGLVKRTPSDSKQSEGTNGNEHRCSQRLIDKHNKQQIDEEETESFENEPEEEFA
jgi:hypothetical protein